MTYQEKVLRYRVSYRDLFVEKRIAEQDGVAVQERWSLEYSTNDFDDAVQWFQNSSQEWADDRLYRITDTGSESTITRTEF